MGKNGVPEPAVMLCGQFIGVLRTRKGLSRKELIARLHRELDEDDPLYYEVSDSWLRRLEAGVLVKFPRSTILALSRALRCTPEEQGELLIIADRNPLADDNGRMSQPARVLAGFVILLNNHLVARSMIEIALTNSPSSRLSEEELMHLFSHIMARVAPSLCVENPLQTLNQVNDNLETPMQVSKGLQQKEDISLVANAAPLPGQVPDVEFVLRPELGQTLVALANGASTALEIKKEITTRTQEQYSVGISTIQRVLQALQKDRFIQCAGETRHQENIYALTADGSEIALMAVRVEKHRVELDAQRHLAQEIEEEHNKRVAEKEHRLIEEQRQLNKLLQSLSLAD
jgi:DNA-binding PadR family transcriptional regulator